MPPQVRRQTLYYIEDDKLFATEFAKHVPPHWRYVCLPDSRLAIKALAKFERGDGLVLDMGFGADRYKGLEVLQWARSHKTHILDATVIFTAWDDGDTRAKLQDMKLLRIPVISKSTKIELVIQRLQAMIKS